MSSPATGLETQSSDYAEIDAVTRDYAEGWYEGNSVRMDRALHTDLVKRTLGGEAGSLRGVTKARMVKLTADGGGEMPGAEVEVLIDDISTNIASARVISPEYLDYLHLVRAPDGWKIANVLFEDRF